jgi:hypothetical protein
MWKFKNKQDVSKKKGKKIQNQAIFIPKLIQETRGMRRVIPINLAQSTARLWSSDSSHSHGAPSSRRLFQVPIKIKPTLN